MMKDTHEVTSMPMASLHPSASVEVRTAFALREIDRLLGLGARLGLSVRTAAAMHAIDPGLLAELATEKVKAALEARLELARLAQETAKARAA